MPWSHSPTAASGPSCTSPAPRRTAISSTTARRSSATRSATSPRPGSVRADVRPLITFLSDYGTTDEFVGVVHGVIARVSPEARVIDVTHGIPRHAVEVGARVLVRALPFMPAGVHLAVVDPEVGAGRRALALRLAEEERFLVGPDNGLLIPAAERFGG